VLDDAPAKLAVGAGDEDHGGFPGSRIRWAYFRLPIRFEIAFNRELFVAEYETMDRLDGMAVFIRVAEAGSFTAVAEQLGLARSAVTRSIAALEAHLGVKLIARSTRSLKLTAEGGSTWSAAARSWPWWMPPRAICPAATGRRGAHPHQRAGEFRCTPSGAPGGGLHHHLSRGDPGHRLQ
jgi:hypothetical protein